MSETTCIILCGGESSRWNNYLDVPVKHLIEVEGEILLARTLRQVAAFKPDKTIIVVHQDHKDLFTPYVGVKCELFVIKTLLRRPTEAWKYFSSEPLWQPGDNTINLLGDVWFSDEAIKSVFETPVQDWLAFGRPNPSGLTGCAYGEIFAHKFNDPDDHREKFILLDYLYKIGECRRTASGWSHYHLMHGLDPKKQNIGPRFVEIDDFTEDFDYPEDYDNWNLGRRFFKK